MQYWKQINICDRPHGDGNHRVLIHGNDGYAERTCMRVASDDDLGCWIYDVTEEKPAYDERTNAERERDTAIEELTEAIRYTVEYLGVSTLPAREGWSWYDAMVKYAPEKAAVFRESWLQRFAVFEERMKQGTSAPKALLDHFGIPTADG